MKRMIVLALFLLLPALVRAADGAPEAPKGAPPEAAKRFIHQDHLANAPDCRDCHKAGDLSIVPDLARCDECHDKGYAGSVSIPSPVTHDSFWYRGHQPYAKAQGRNCDACHDERFCLDCHKAGFADQQGKINIHRSDFRVTHPIVARADNRSCSVCHESSFCVDCHQSFRPEDLTFLSHRRQFRDVTAVPRHEIFTVDQCQGCHRDSVLPSHRWSEGHAREARRALPTCQACHPDGDVCLGCHSAREGLIVNPHPRNWDDIKDILNGASGGRTCRRCH